MEGEPNGENPETHPSEGRNDRERIKEKVWQQIKLESAEGKFNVPNDPSIVGMIVFTEGGEFPRGITIKVVDIDVEHGVAMCEDKDSGDRHLVRVGNLRDPNAIKVRAEELARDFRDEFLISSN